MKAKIFSLTIIILFHSYHSYAKEHEIVTSLHDTFVLSDTNDYHIEVKRYLTLRFADIQVLPKNDGSFNLMLYFKSDTKDLAQFNNPEKIAASIRKSSEEYLPYITEKQIIIKDLSPKSYYGSYTVMTDNKLSKVKVVPPNEFRYLGRGMLRVSQDSVLGFSLMTNDIQLLETRKLLAFIQSFVIKK